MSSLNGTNAAFEAWCTARDQEMFDMKRRITELEQTIHAQREMLKAIVDVIDRQGGWMTTPDQWALWRAREESKR